MGKIELNIIHFNDVYDIREKKSEPVAGFPRFTTAVKSYADKNPMLLFSGDAFNPSIMSSVTKGKHIVTVLNYLKVQCSVVGNHEFDFGIETAAKYIAGCNFPWLLSNVNDKSGNTIVGSKRTATINWNGVKVGFVGLAEEEWLDTVKLVLKDVEYVDFVQVGKELVKQLKDEGADVIIALTPQVVAQQVPGVDLILNGHDHFYEVLTVNGIKVVTSGVDFKDLSFISMVKNPGDTAFTVTVEEVHVTSKFERDPEAQAMADSFNSLLDKKLLKQLGETEVELDCTTSTVRTKESNFANMVADIMRDEMKTDIGFVAGGTIRSDATYGPGPFIVGDLMNIFPFTDIVVSFQITGALFKKTLETSVGKWPDQVGRFGHVSSGVKFGFDPSKPEGERINWVIVNGAPLDLEKIYTATTTEYIASGNDGYDECLGLKNLKYIIDEEGGVLLSTIVRRYFIRMKVMQSVGQVMLGLFEQVHKKKVKEIGQKLDVFTVHPKVEGRIVNEQKH